MKYMVTKTGFMDGHLYKVGDSFEGEEGMRGKWFVPAAEYVPEVEKPSLKAPSTLSEIARMAPAPGPVTSPGRRPGRPAKTKE